MRAPLHPQDMFMSCFKMPAMQALSTIVLCQHLLY